MAVAAMCALVAWGPLTLVVGPKAHAPPSGKHPDFSARNPYAILDKNWAPEFGGRIGFPPPEKNELVLFY